MTGATPDEKAAADVVLQTLDEALRKVAPFYDARIVLGVLMGMTSAFGASLYRAKMLDAQGLADYYSAGLAGAFIHEGPMPTVRIQNEKGNGTKQ